MKHTRALRRVARSSQGPNPDEECVRGEPSAHIMDKCALLLPPTWQSLSTLQLAYEHSYYCNPLLENANWNSCEINSLSTVSHFYEAVTMKVFVEFAHIRSAMFGYQGRLQN